MRKFINPLFFIFIYSNIAIAQVGFNGGGGFTFYLAKPDFGAINAELQELGMPEIDNVMMLYGGQAFAHVSNRMRVGGMGFGGSTHVSDMESGYAREVCVHLAWGGILAEYIVWEGYDFEVYAGGTVGWGHLRIRTEKIADPANWDEIWGNLEPGASPADNISSQLEHSFFIGQPRLGLRYYLTTWLALSGSIDLTLFNLNSSGWELNGKDVYNAPSLAFSQPFFQLAILFGG